MNLALFLAAALGAALIVAFAAARTAMALRAERDSDAFRDSVNHRFVLQTKDGQSIEATLEAAYPDSLVLVHATYLSGGGQEIGGRVIVPRAQISWGQRRDRFDEERTAGIKPPELREVS